MRAAPAVALLALAAGCLARTTTEPRFFRPDSTLIRESYESDPRVAKAGPLRAVRIRAVDGESFLRERVVWRASGIEYAFDEVLAPAHVAAVEATVSLRDGHGQLLLERPFAAAMPIAGDDPATMAAAMGGALDDVAARIADAVADAVPAPPGSAPRENRARRTHQPIPRARTQS